MIGNKLTEKEKRNTLTEYAYDAENRVTEVTKDSLRIAAYDYDGNGNRKGKTGVRTQFSLICSTIK